MGFTIEGVVTNAGCLGQNNGSIALTLIAPQSSPFAIAISPSGLTAYVTNTNESTLSVISTSSNAVTNTILVGNSPNGVAVTPDGLHAYVTNYIDGTVSVIDTSRNAVATTISGFTNPYGVAVTPDGLHVYVADYGANKVYVISTASNTITANITVGTNPLGVAITPDGLHVYVTNWASTNVSVISTASNTVVHTTVVGDNPSGVAITPDGLHVYVDNSSANSVSVIATSSNTVIHTTSVGDNPSGVAITPDGLHVYVTNNTDGTVSVISTTSNTVSSIITVGSNPYGVAIVPSGVSVYVCNDADGTLSVISTVSNNVTDTITVSDAPYTFMWSNGATTQNISNLSVGHYWVSVNNYANLSETADFFVTGANILLDYIIQQPKGLLGKGSIKAIPISISGTTFTYLWSTGATTQAIDNLSAGNYTVTVTSNLGCAVTDTVTLVSVSQYDINFLRCCSGKMAVKYVCQREGGEFDEAEKTVSLLKLLQGYISDLCDFQNGGICLSDITKTKANAKNICECCCSDIKDYVPTSLL